MNQDDKEFFFAFDDGYFLAGSFVAVVAKSQPEAIDKMLSAYGQKGWSRMFSSRQEATARGLDEAQFGSPNYG